MPSTSNITAVSRQTVYEIAIQEYGSLDGLAYIIEDNEILRHFIGQPLTGKEVAIRFFKLNKRVNEFFSKEEINPVNFNKYYVPLSGPAPLDPFDELGYLNITYYDPEN